MRIVEDNSASRVAAAARTTRLGVVISHPIQYFSPWFVHLAKQPGVELKVFYLWDFGVRDRRDPDFGVAFTWDIPLLEGYQYELVPNVSRTPGTGHFWGLRNPGLLDALEAWRPDVLLVFGYNFYSHVRLFMSRRLRKVPIILRGDSHDLGRSGGLKEAAKRLLRKALFRRADAFLAVGSANESYFRRCAKNPRQVFVARHFVDNDRFRHVGESARCEARAWRSELGMPHGCVVFGFIGKFEPKKRPLDLLEASAGLHEESIRRGSAPPVFLFVGAGSEEQELRRRAGERVGQDVFFAPFQNQTAMPRVYAALDVIVLPSGYGETWGLCVNEAMNLGVPAVVSDVVGCGPDLVIPRETGWVFTSGDTAQLRATLTDAAALTPEQRVRMSERVRAHVAKFSVGSATEGLLRTIEAVATSREADRHA